LPGPPRARRGGGIYLSDDEDQPTPTEAVCADDEDGVEAEEASAPGVHAKDGPVQEESKPKPKSAMDDLWEEMKRGSSVKKSAPAAKTDISSFINGLVSKSSSAASAKSGKVDVASLFPTTVSKKATVKVRKSGCRACC
jgi:hypothetical protein